MIYLTAATERCYNHVITITHATQAVHVLVHTGFLLIMMAVVQGPLYSSGFPTATDER